MPSLDILCVGGRRGFFKLQQDFTGYVHTTLVACHQLYVAWLLLHTQLVLFHATILTYIPIALLCTYSVLCCSCYASSKGNVSKEQRNSQVQMNEIVHICKQFFSVEYQYRLVKAYWLSLRLILLHMVVKDASTKHRFIKMLNKVLRVAERKATSE